MALVFELAIDWCIPEIKRAIDDNDNDEAALAVKAINWYNGVTFKRRQYGKTYALARIFSIFFF